MSVAAAALFVIATPSHAQFAGALDISSGLGQIGSGAWQRESRLAPAARLSHAAGFLHADAVVAEGFGKTTLRNSRFDAAVNSPSVGILRASVSGSYTYDASPALPRATSFEAAGALSAKLGANGLWIGTSRASAASMQFNLGAWRVIRNAILSVTSHTQSMRVQGSRAYVMWDSTYDDTTDSWNYYQRTVGGDSSGTHVQAWSDLEARIDWALGRLMLSAAMSGRRSRDSTQSSMTWGRVQTVYQLNSRLFLTGGFGSVPVATKLGVSSSRFATLGIRLTPAAFLRPPLPAAVRPTATGLSVHRLGTDTVRLVLRVPNARVVEISGDFNRWIPIALRETGPNVWETTIALRAGTHRLNMRVDGDVWTVPPGLPAIDDEFSGRVGLLVVK